MQHEAQQSENSARKNPERGEGNRLGEERRSELQKQGILYLSKAGGPKFTDSWFPYTSGEVGPYFIQSLAITKQGHTYRWAIDALCEIVTNWVGADGFDVVSGGESRDWDFSNPVAYALEKPHAKLYKDGTIIGADISGKRVLHVADLNNEGSSMRDRWLPAIRKADGRLVGSVFFVERMEAGAAVMEKLGIPTRSVITMNEHAWKVLLDSGYIDKKLFSSLKKRLEDRRAWAHNALRTHIDKLGKMLQDENPKTVKRAEKILTHGYPEIREELEHLLREKGWKIPVLGETDRGTPAQSENTGDNFNGRRWGGARG